MPIPEFVPDKSLTLHRAFEAQVEKTPEAIALVFEQEQLTYRELNERANQLAHYLRSLNVAPEMLVGICLERSIEMIVGMLGILKAGAAFVPLDPSQPPERLAFILADTKVKVLLTFKKLVAGISVHQGHLVCLDTECENITTKSKNNLKSGVRSDNLAYTIYTSGSTEKPKGVMVNHQAICQGFLWMQEIFPLTPQDRILQKMPLTFDFSFWELFWPLMTGACVVLTQPGSEKDSAYLIKLIAQQEISILVFVPSVLQVFLSEQGLKTCENIRMVFTSGEPLTSALKDRFFNQLPNCQLYDLFGATENIVVTYWPCQPEEKLFSFSQGHPFPNLSIYVVDEQLQIVPVGETGELLVGGWGLARGYLNRKELTAQKFISNPFKENSQERLYRTGDQVRYLSDGTIEILGRIDNQVKIRGFRIELGEVEETLSQHPAVKQVAVIAREDVAGGKRLVAYAVLHSSQELKPNSISDLRQFLKQQLPDYMIPSGFVVLEALPLSPNGKVDRHALPVPEIRPTDLPTFVAPRTPIEEMLANIWSNILRVDEVGIHDNFFTLGGDSLLAVQIISRMCESLGVELPFSRLLEFPTIAGLVKIVEEASQQEVPLQSLPLQPILRNQTIPLGFSQEQLWFLYQLTPEEPVYNEPCTIRLRGAINVDALEKALNEIIRRHESLRTRFLTVNGQPVQVIDLRDTINLTLVDLRQLPPEQREAEALWLATKQAKQPFDLTSDLLLRATLMQLADVDYRLFLTFHHIIIDDVSIHSVFLPELTALYEAYLKGKPSPLALLPIQYADFAVWQRQWLTQEILESQLDYWKQQLADLPVLQLPYDRPRPAVGTFRGAWQCLALSKDLTEALEVLSQQEGVTLYMTLLAAFKALLYRYSEQEDLVVGTVSARRNRPEIEGLIGYFLNTLVLRTNLSGNPSFRQLLGRVREVTLGAYAHEDLPYQKLVQTLQPERNFSQNPLFQVALVQEAPMPSLNSDWTRSYLDVQTDTAKFNLTLELDFRSEGIVGRFEYNTDLFEAATISRMIGHLQTMLAEIVANPQARVSELPLLTERERYQLLVEWNNTTKEYPFDKCIHQLFEEQVERSPDAIAVVFEDKQLTYRELNQRANRIAHYLKSLGVGANTLVGICVERSLEMVVGLLGILKADGAYVPLDPTYPKERLAFMLENAQARVLLTQQQLIESLPLHQVSLICLDTNWQVIAQQSEKNPAIGVTPDNLAYVIYTSGSTGKPKGVAMSHRSLSNLIEWQVKNSTISRQARTLQFSPLSFDVSFQEIFSTWCSGGTLVLIADEVRRDPLQLWRFLTKEAIAKIFLPFVALQQLAEVADTQETFPASLCEIITAGEQLLISRQIKKLFAKLNNCTLQNQYGPSESHVVTAFTLTGSSSDWPVFPSTGRPITNTQIYILDPHLQLVPIGVSGELYIGGVALAQGYVNHPLLTDERFISNPFSNKSGERLYKTGDRVRYLPDGNIEFLGRIDNQVKIRGFRIESGEIEAVLAQHSAVRETVVIVRGNIAGEKQLVAYVVSYPEAVLVINDLRYFLKRQLPDYMIPSAFVILDALPLTPNGKVDRRTLPAPEFQPELELSFVAPRTPVEEILASIWAEVLGVQQVGVNDNFFEIGGHSLLATQVISRVRDAFTLEIPLRSLFEAPTIAQLQEYIQAALTNEQSTQVPPLVAIPRPAQIPLSFAQARLWFLNQLQPESALYSIPLALRLSGQLNLVALESSINEIIRRHESLRTNFTIKEGQPVQIIATALNLKLVVVDLENLPACEQEIETQRLVTQLAVQHFDLEREPLLRANVLQLGSTEYVFVLVLDHIIADGWSLSVLQRELATYYRAFCNGLTPVLAELPIQYADFALWQRNWLTGEVLQTQIDHWQQQLKGVPTLLELPTDRPRPAIQKYRGAHLSIPLSVELSEQIVLLSKRAGVTLFVTLLAAFQALLYRYTGSDDIVVGTPIANRNHQEIEGLIGFFVNTLVLRTDLSGNPSFEQLLGRVREVTLGAYAHQDLPFEELVEVLQPERSLSHSPLFQVMFTLENTPAYCLDLHELTVSSLPVEIPTAKFDLTLSMKNTLQGLIADWEYNTDLFDADTIARMVGHLQTLLEAIVANPQQPISELALLTEAEQQQLLVEWNNTRTEYSQDKCIHQLFEEQVDRTPHAIALVFEDQQLTYQELNAKANQLAHYLQKLGVKSEVPVGICVERSLEMIIGILGILKAGGAYVPLDPAYPQKRLGFMLEDTAIAVLLTQQHLIKLLPSHQVTVICLDSDWQAITQNSKENPDDSATSDNLAYVIYTSGSTGKPKGVLVEHRGIVNLVRWHQEAFAVSPTDRTTQLAGFAFDASVWEIWSCLTAGASLYIANEQIRLLPSQLQAWLIVHNITVSFLPTALAEQILLLDWSRDVTLRVLIIGGDKLQCYPAPSIPFRVVNNYGPTESTVVTTSGIVSAHEQVDVVRSIGKPISNTQIYILDRHLQPVPMGVSGELYVGGDGLARGYLNRPDLMQEKFIPNPFSNEPRSRLYKTGDLARYLSDGNIEFLGRIDDQVKIRGFRIELGEIEAMLNQHPAVQRAVVVVREEESRDKRLVAYCVTQPKTFSARELRAFLKQRLPHYMIPTDFMPMEALPLTPNGKVDRKALPAPDRDRSQLENHFVVPRTSTEVSIAQIWAQVLGLQQVGVNDNFFELGGHSLLATQIISRIRSAFSIELPLRSLFEAPTIASLAQVIETAQKEELQEQSEHSTKLDILPPLLPVVRDTHILLSFAQQTVWELQQLHIDSSAYNSPIVLCLNGLLIEEVLEKSINEIIRRHQILRTTFTLVEEQPVQIIAQSLILPLDVIDLQHLTQQEREVEAIRLSNQEAVRHFDLASGPLIKTTLLCLAPKKHWLLITMHHIITDGWSYNIFLQELGTLYEALSNGLPSSLPEVTLQYADFTLWQQKYLNEETLEKQRSYWLQKLANIPPKLDLLPGFRPKFKSSSKRTGSYSIILPYDQVTLIEALSRSQGVTIFAIILAALKILLHKLSGQTDIIILAATANRSTPEMEKMLGCFINDVFLRDKIDDFQTGFTFLEQVNQTIGEALANQEIPEKLLRNISELESIRTINVSMAPPIHWHSGTLDWEVASVSLDHDLWDEQSCPLEVYVHFQDRDSTAIEIVSFYSTSCFTDKSIKCFFQDYQEIVKQLTKYSRKLLSEFMLASYR